MSSNYFLPANAAAMAAASHALPHTLPTQICLLSMDHDTATLSVVAPSMNGTQDLESRRPQTDANFTFDVQFDSLQDYTRAGVGVYPDRQGPDWEYARIGKIQASRQSFITI